MNADQRLRIGLAVLVVGLVAGLVAFTVWPWASKHFVRETHRVDRGPTAEAMRLPYLAAQRALEQLGQPVTSVSTGPEADPGPHDVLLFAVADENENAAQWHEQLAWVRAGGTLIVNTEVALRNSSSKAQTGFKPLLDYLHVTTSRDEDEVIMPGERNRLATISLPNAPYILRLFNCFCWNLHASAKRTPDVSDDSGKTVLAYKEGAGMIVLLNNDNLLNQLDIGNVDNAELLWRLTQLNGKPPRVWLVWQGVAQPWQLLLWRNFAPLLLALTVFTGFAIWRGWVRFGPLLPAPQPVRRSLVEHLDACGRWFWQKRKHAVLLDACRGHLRRTLQRHLPQLAQLPAPQLAPRLARLSGRDEHAIGLALSANGSRDTHEFTAQVALLQALTLAVENQHRKL